MSRRLTHARVGLVLHELRGGSGRPLLLLHELGGAAPTVLPEGEAAWSGPVFALDFTGHGDATVPTGGGYHPEMLMGDADVALAEIGPVTLLGRGLGAYVAVLLAGGRPQEVRGAIVCDGRGLAGGGPEPAVVEIPMLPSGAAAGRAPDPFALLELSRDVRPPDYVSMFVRLAVTGSGLPEPITVVAEERPAWLTAAVAEPGVTIGTLPDALARYAAIP